MRVTLFKFGVLKQFTKAFGKRLVKRANKQQSQGWAPPVRFGHLMVGAIIDARCNKRTVTAKLVLKPDTIKTLPDYGYMVTMVCTDKGREQIKEVEFRETGGMSCCLVKIK